MYTEYDDDDDDDDNHPACLLTGSKIFNEMTFTP